MIGEVRDLVLRVKQAADIMVSGNSVAQLQAKVQGLESQISDRDSELTNLKLSLQGIFDAIKPPAPTVSISVDSASIPTDGTLATFTVTVAGHYSSVVMDNGIGAVTMSDNGDGTFTGNATAAGLLAGPVDYTVTVTGLGGTATASVSVTWTS